MNRELKVFTDGGARGNPGPAAAGIVIFNAEDKLLKINGKYLGEMTNNQAEYEALISALRMIQVMQGVEKITCYLDSDLAVKQLRGEYKIKDEELKAKNVTIQKLIGKYESVEFVHVRREENKFADKLVNIVLDAREIR